MIFTRQKKFIVTLFYLGIFLCHFNNLHAQYSPVTKPSPLTICLAKEEMRLHKAKIVGPITTLNKELLSKMSSVQQLFLKKNYLESVCNTKSGGLSPSLKFLNILLTRGVKIFYSTTEDINYKGFQQNFLEDLERHGAKLLFDFLAGLQASTAIADCLNEEIPILGQISERYKVLEVDIGPKQLLKPEEVPEIFKKLKNLDSIYESCEKKRAEYEAKLLEASKR